MRAVFRLSVLAVDKTSTPPRRTALGAPTSDLSDPCGLPPAPAQPAATPRVTLTRATLPAAPPQALRAPTRTDALVCCFRLSPFHSFSPHDLGWSRVRSLGCIHPTRTIIPGPGPPASRHQLEPPLRHTGTHCPSLGLRLSGFAASGCAAFQYPARLSGPMPSAQSLSTLPILLRSPASARCLPAKPTS